MWHNLGQVAQGTTLTVTGLELTLDMASKTSRHNAGLQDFAKVSRYKFVDYSQRGQPEIHEEKASQNSGVAFKY